MTSFEKAEIRRLPNKYRPMGLCGYFWHTLLYIIPVLGLAFLIWGACNDKNVSRRSFARCFIFMGLLIAAIALVYTIVLVALEFVKLDSIVETVGGILSPVKKLLGK